MTTIKLRHDTASNWTTVNPILAEGEIGIELNPQTYELNIELIGNIVNTSGVLSNFYYLDNYANITTENHSSPSEVTFTTKVRLNSYNSSHDDIISNKSSVRPIGFTQGQLGMWNGSNWQFGSVVYPINTDIWVRVIQTRTTIKIYGLIDDSYTFETLPDISNWNFETEWYTGDYYDILLGTNWIGTSEAAPEYFNGSIDMNETYIYVDGAVAYKYSKVKSNNKIKIGDGLTSWNDLGYLEC